MFLMNQSNPKCANCWKTVYKAEEVAACGSSWHKACFKCGGGGGGCGKTLSSTSFFGYENVPYCKKCYENVQANSNGSKPRNILHTKSMRSEVDTDHAPQKSFLRSQSVDDVNKSQQESNGLATNLNSRLAGGVPLPHMSNVGLKPPPPRLIDPPSIPSNGSQQSQMAAPIHQVPDVINEVKPLQPIIFQPHPPLPPQPNNIEKVHPPIPPKSQIIAPVQKSPEAGNVIKPLQPVIFQPYQPPPAAPRPLNVNPNPSIASNGAAEEVANDDNDIRIIVSTCLVELKKSDNCLIYPLTFDFETIATEEDALNEDSMSTIVDHVISVYDNKKNYNVMVGEWRSSMNIDERSNIVLSKGGLGRLIPKFRTAALDCRSLYNSLQDNDEVFVLTDEVKFCWIKVELGKGKIDRYLAIVNASYINFLQLKEKISALSGQNLSIVSGLVKSQSLKDLNMVNILVFRTGFTLLVSNLSNVVDTLYFDNCDSIEELQHQIGIRYSLKIDPFRICLQSQDGRNSLSTSMDLQKFKNSNTIFSLQYCSNQLCKGIIRSVKIISKCNHRICDGCLSDHLLTKAREFQNFQEREDAADEDDIKILKLGRGISEMNQSYLKYLFTFNSEDPKLKNIACPTPNCKSCLLADDVCDLEVYNQAVMHFYSEYDAIQSYQYCSLKDVIYCTDEKCPLTKLMTLGCGHFYHPSCLASYINGQLDKIKERNKQLVCYKCEQLGPRSRSCGCPYCHGRVDADGQQGIHIFNERDANELHMRSPQNFHIQNKERWKTFSSDVEAMLVMQATHQKLFSCRCGIPIALENDDDFKCPRCFLDYCGKCLRLVHDGMTCEELTAKETEEAIPEGMIIQHCPYCDKPWGVPIDCLHATCEKIGNGCGGEFCYVCAAPRSPIIGHNDNIYHRPSCKYYSTGCKFGCTKDCFKKGDKFCSHSVFYNPDKCSECKRLGTLCPLPLDPPLEGKRCKILDQEKVLAESKRLNGNKGDHYEKK